MFDFDVSKVFLMEKREKKVFYEKINGRLMYEETIGENSDGINKLKSQLDLLAKNLAKVNDTI